MLMPHVVTLLHSESTAIHLAGLSCGLKGAVGEAPKRLRCGLAGRYPCHIVTPSFHKGNHLVVIGVFEAHLIRHELIVQSRCRKRFGRRHVLIQNVPISKCQ